MTISVTTWAAAGVGLVLVAALGVQTVRLSDEQAAHSTTVATYANERFRASELTARATDEQRAVFEARIGEKDAIIQTAQRLAAQRATALADSRRVGDSLRDERAAHLARNAGETCIGANAGSGSPPGATPVRLLDELFGEADEFAGIVAEAFEGSRAAGLTCEAQYLSLEKPAPLRQAPQPP